MKSFGLINRLLHQLLFSSMPHVEEERSQSLLFDEAPDSNFSSKEACLKRKRGFCPYTEDDGGYISSANESTRLSCSPAARLFEDSVAWYQWKRKSFATPDERVNKFSVPKSNTESEDEFWDAPEPQSEKYYNDLQSATSESHSCELPIEKNNICSQCEGIKDPSVIEQSKRFKSIPPLSRLEETLHSSVNCMVVLADRVTSGCHNIKRGTRPV